jgi:glycosyltransferase involved in cell wall biosynthesis
MNILFLVPYPSDEAPSQRFRFEQYYTALSKAGHQYSIQSFFTPTGWRSLYTGSAQKKAFLILLGFFRRFFILFTVPRYEAVFIHREAAPVGPPFIEWIIKFIFRKKIIYDFDDAIWLTDKLDETRLESVIRWRKKVTSICSWSYKVSCGNEYLAAYASRWNSKVIINPTTIDTERLHNPSRFMNHHSDKIIIGWTGSHSTLKYLKTIEPALRKLEEKYPNISILVIADQKPQLLLNSLVFKPWSKESEISDLNAIDIGIMPLPDDEWSKGKCGFKALQYLALEIPTIASPVGVNSMIVDNNVNGFLCSTSEEWTAALEKLLHDEPMRKRFGANGRQRVIDQFSVSSNTTLFLSLFQ